MNQIESMRKMLSSKQQVWVRHNAKGRAPHQSRARLLELHDTYAIIKPIKHGGRIEKVPINTIKLWHSMNNKIGNRNEKI